MEFGDGNFDESTFSEYMIDDTLDPLAKLEKYCTSEFALQRLVLVRDLPDTATQIGYKETVNRIVPLLSNFVSDGEAGVRQAFAEKLPSLADFFLTNGAEKGYNQLVNLLLPFAFELIIDRNADVGHASTDAIMKMSKLVKPEHVQAKLLSVVCNLAHDDKVEEFRTIAGKLLCDLSSTFGKDVSVDKVVPEIIVLSQDSNFGVRKAVAQNLWRLAECIGPEGTLKTKLFSIYQVLCKDEIWGVRKSCAETLPLMSKQVNNETRIEYLVQIFETFSEDISRWVKTEAFKQLGPFIATFGKSDDVSNNLIDLYTGMILQQQNDSDLIEFCAYNFPAVTLTLGHEKWPLLEKAYGLLVKDVQWKVRRTLSCSLHEMAKILGVEITEQHLCPAFEAFLKDLDEVKLGVVQNMASFINSLGESKEKYFTLVSGIAEDADSWRIREEIARQLPNVLELATPTQVKEILYRMPFSLFDDAYATVRKAAFACCGVFFKKLSQLENGSLDFVKYLTGLASNEICFKRQMFCFAMESIILIIDKETCHSHFTSILGILSHDSVANVRMSVAKILTIALKNIEIWKDDETFSKLRDAMKKDEKDKDVLDILAQ